MNIRFGRIPTLLTLAFALAGFGSLTGCLGDDSDAESDSGGGRAPTAGTSGSGGTTAGTGGSGGSAPAGTVCAAPIVLAASKPAITDFENYQNDADLSTWSFPLGGDPATGVFSGTFGYGDDYSVDPKGLPESFEMVDGNDSTYALGISDTLAEEYGGGLGLWLSGCLDATAFGGISFWVRGNSPSGEAKLTVLMGETTSATPAMADSKFGTCTGTDETCIHPTLVFPVTDTWTEVRVAWSSLMPGNAAGTLVVPNGKNIWQIQFDVGLVWADNGAGVYEPTPAEYEFAIDDLTFF